METSRRITWVIALIMLVGSATVYFTTLAPTVPFWDAGEFIACTAILGIPHPPGTPFTVLLGRIAGLVPLGSFAQRINGLSAFCSMFTVMLTYLTGLKLIRLALGKERTSAHEWIAHVGAVTGSLLFAFSDNFWDNSIETEAYALVSLAQILVLWLGLRWWEEHERRPTARPLLLCVYLMWLCVGLHPAVGMLALPLIVLVWLVDHRAGLVFTMPLLPLLLVTTGLERMCGGVIVLATLSLVVYAFQGKVNGMVVAACTVPALYAMWIAFGDATFNRFSALVAVASILVPMVLLARRAREGRIMLLALSLMAIGYSTHAYLPIRAAQHPAINEGNPSNWQNLSDLLERKQYGQMDMFVRRAPWSVQLDKEFWRYFRRQWPLFPTDRLWGALLPLALGLAGGWWQLRRERTSFLYMFCFLGISTAGMILFLNFSPNEVRDRDYFFQSGYHAYSLWIGLGVAWLIGWVRDSFPAGTTQNYATLGTAVVLACQPFMLLINLWFTHDRRGNYVARDYAYNMLAPLKPNAFVFTNGDNDTFPLWYIQEVEGFRKDVRVVNLSLLNTDWYIQQLRDEPPKVPIHLDDASIRTLGMGAVQDPTTGRIIYTNEFMVHHIMTQDTLSTGWKVPPYFAVTVPEDFGYRRQFTLEGLVYRVNRDTLQPSVDIEATRHSMYDVFKYRGLFKADGSWDSTVYKDENAATLSRNYAAAHIQMALVFHRRHEYGKAIAEMERVERMFPEYTDMLITLGGFYLDSGDTAKALDLYTRVVARSPDNPEAHYYYGVALVYRRQVQAALHEFDMALRLDPNYAQAYYACYYTLWEAGHHEEALTYLERWASAHPEDAQAREIIDAQRPNRQLMPKPPVPSLP